MLSIGKNQRGEAALIFSYQAVQTITQASAAEGRRCAGTRAALSNADAVDIGPEARLVRLCDVCVMCVPPLQAAILIGGP